MSLSNPKQIFGIHSWTPYSRTTGEFYGMLRCLESASIALQGSQIDLYAGSNKFAWASETGQVSSDMSLKFAEFPDFLYTVFFGVTPTATTSETSGDITVAANKTGTSMISAAGLLTPVVIPTTGAANLKFGKYVIKAVSATAFDIYLSTDVDITRGTDESYNSDLLVIQSVTGVATGANSDAATVGLRFVGGGSATAFVVGDTATFEVRPVNSKSSVVTVGGASDVFPEFGSIVVAQHRSNDEMFEIDCFRCKGSGMPFPLDMFAWAKSDVKVKLLYDSTLNGVFKSRFVQI